MERNNWSSTEMAAVADLVAAWDAMVADGEMDEADLAETLVDQLSGDWDHSVEDAEDHPEIAALVGLDLEADPKDPDEAEGLWEIWSRVSAEAARQWLAAHGPTPEEQHQAALDAMRRAEDTAMWLAEVGWDPRLAELGDQALALAQAARDLARQLEQEMGQEG